MDKTVQYTIITNKEFSFPNCINMLPTIVKKDTDNGSDTKILR